MPTLKSKRNKKSSGKKKKEPNVKKIDVTLLEVKEPKIKKDDCTSLEVKKKKPDVKKVDVESLEVKEPDVKKPEVKFPEQITFISGRRRATCWNIPESNVAYCHHDNDKITLIENHHKYYKLYVPENISDHIVKEIKFNLEDFFLLNKEIKTVTSKIICNPLFDTSKINADTLKGKKCIMYNFWIGTSFYPFYPDSLSIKDHYEHVYLIITEKGTLIKLVINEKYEYMNFKEDHEHTYYDLYNRYQQILYTIERLIHFNNKDPNKPGSCDPTLTYNIELNENIFEGLLTPKVIEAMNKLTSKIKSPKDFERLRGAFSCVKYFPDPEGIILDNLSNFSLFTD